MGGRPRRAAASIRLRRARWCTAGSFAGTGLVFATWAARVPARKADLDLSDGQLSLAFVGLNAGAVIGLQLGALVVTRLGSRGTVAVALPLFAALLLPLAWAPGLPSLTAALALSAAVNSVVDVAINDQGIGLQRSYGRSLLSGLHAAHSLGGVSGGALAAGAAALGLPLDVHFGLVAAAVGIGGYVGSRGLLPHDAVSATPRRQESPRAVLAGGWTARLLLVGALAFVVTLAEGSALDWSAVLLDDHRGTGPAAAAAGLATFQVAVTAGRLAGDRLVDRLGPVTVFRLGALTAGIGCSAGLASGSAVGAFAGLALLGLGIATLLPVAISAAGAAAAVPVPVAVARVSALGYLGSFTGPLAIGALAGVVGLPAALVVPAVAVGVCAGAARVVAARPRGRRGLVVDRQH